MVQSVTIRREFGPLDYAFYLRQTVVNIAVDSEGYAFGLWGKLFVAAFSRDAGTWHVVDVPEGARLLLLDRIAREN